MQLKICKLLKNVFIEVFQNLVSKEFQFQGWFFILLNTVGDFNFQQIVNLLKMKCN